MYVLLGFWQ